MADVRHQGNGGQFFQGDAGLTRIGHCQVQPWRFTGRFAASGNQQPLGGIARGDEILASAQAQVVEAGLHVRRAQAALFGGTQGTEALRRAGPQHPQRRLVPHQERQARRGHQACPGHGQFERRHRPQALQQR
ncbi:hypothetical protein D3C78_1224220 [compost metagenome]